MNSCSADEANNYSWRDSTGWFTCAAAGENFSLWLARIAFSVVSLSWETCSKYIHFAPIPHSHTNLHKGFSHYSIHTRAGHLKLLIPRCWGASWCLAADVRASASFVASCVTLREFYYLRYCIDVEPGMWVMVDVSYDQTREDSHDSTLRSWRCPSGCGPRYVSVDDVQ
ncbi:uncharacterized protein LOC131302693 isoform X2 [Rhododendron vialii]|uniref:uncharacterized protein LOC131302693 isoform X2 n=1 Tax=Rhododendron vialii TaxID=182163 RepID=UPI00265F48B4|nr:uncharacterized protein LOC131302693 isoform X2 [Rhododendron vialii]